MRRLLEWKLPRWLADTMGLAPELDRELVLANLFDLADVRLLDDRVNGEADGEGEISDLLDTAIRHPWLGQYVDLLARHPAFGRFGTVGPVAPCHGRTPSADCGRVLQGVLENLLPCSRQCKRDHRHPAAPWQGLPSIDRQS